MRIYIIRHGETDANARGVFQGRSDHQLLESGVRLARITGRAMRDIVFDAAFSSPLSRAMRTAIEVLDASGNAHVPVRPDDRLLEISMGACEDKRFKPDEQGNREVDAEISRLFFEDPRALGGFSDGERVEGVIARTQGFLSELARGPYGNVLVSTHGFALRAMLNALYDDPSDFWQGHVPYNCAVSIVEADDGACRLVASDVLYYDVGLLVDRYASY